MSLLKSRSGSTSCLFLASLSLGLLTVLASPAAAAGITKQTPDNSRNDEEKTPAKMASEEGYEGAWIYRSFDHLSSSTLIVTFTKQANGSLAAAIDQPEVRLKQQFSVVVVKDGMVQIKQYGLLSVFEAKRSADGKSLDAKVNIGGNWQPLQLARLDKPPAFRRPQDPTRPYPYDEEEVTFKNNKANIRLAGTLTLPRGIRAPHSAVVLLSGSGPDGRDYLAGGHYHFLVLADYLTRRGVAVLRVDDRGVGKSGGVFTQATTEDLAQDAQAAVDYLLQRKDIDPKRIGLIGHSDGATGAALLASLSPDIAFIVMMAGPGVPGSRILVRQSELGLKALGVNEHLIRWNMSVQKQIGEVLQREADVANADKALRQLIADVNARLTDEDRKRMGVDKTFKLDRVVGSTAWLRHFVTYDPRPTLSKVRCPVLALNGDKDLLVWSRDNLPEIEQALKAGGNKDYTVKELPGLNHFFQTCEMGGPAEYVFLEETIAPAALELVGDWIMKRTGQGR
jgi:pimeloyl-ACP methyl ester carboxylesterase